MTTPAILYHYTTQAGMLGILQCDAIRATDLRYLNDTSEYQYAVQLVLGLVDELASMTSVDATILRSAIEKHAETPSRATFVAAFSEVGDLLSQWRSYCKPPDGLALGFDRKALQRVANARNASLRRIRYGESKQRVALQRTLRRAARAFNKAQEGAKKPSAFGQSTPEQLEKLMPLMLQVLTVMQMPDIASFLKHPSFSEEREWRMVLQYQTDIEYRGGGSFLIPFAEMPLGLRTTHALSEVVVCPTPHAALAVESVKSCLQSRLGYKVAVRPSGIPFRAW